MDRLSVAIIVVAIAIPVGGVGAWAFNPDSGAVAHSEALWSIFGLMFELGIPLLMLLAFATAVRTVCRDIYSRRA